ncbi:hypothetical protein, partial [Enterobacter hormaechei]|uniref:hypothetical protein n=1 Tax=Enterobacter hormaechei TaxID=158836 RepID=UPI001954EFBD
ILQAYRVAADRAAVPAGVEDWDAWILTHDPALAAPPRSSDSMIYTSGTTGRPKAVRRQPPTPEQAAKVVAMRTMVYG